MQVVNACDGTISTVTESEDMENAVKKRGGQESQRQERRRTYEKDIQQIGKQGDGVLSRRLRISCGGSGEGAGG